MRKFALTLAAIALSAGALVGKADAMPLGATSPLASAADELNAVEKTQYRWGGRQYCFYPDGWRGPGFYWCGYHLRRGMGWGGPMGWRGWGGPGPRRVIVAPRRGGPVMVVPRGGPRPMMRSGGGGGPKGGGGNRRRP
jgi:hypothetical protein